jgi:hypothetical protein
LLLLILGLCWAGEIFAQAPPQADIHDLTWYVHVDLIDPGAGEDLAYWQGVIDEHVAGGNRLLEGRNGPFDNVCCTRLERSVDVSSFGVSGDGLDIIDSPEDQNAIAGIGTGSRAFLVDSITWCDGSSPGAIGCALRPPCGGDGNDDPNLWMSVTLESFEEGTLSSVIAHERGHNACLQHISSAKCQLMQATVFTPGLGGCLSASECSSYRAARTETTSSVVCDCHADTSGGILPDGVVSTSVEGGVCSGGRCGSIEGDARVALIAAADPGDLSGPPDDAVRVSALTGDWSILGPFSASADDVRALAYAHDEGVLYGIVPTVFDDQVVTIDPATGSILAFIGSIGNGAQEIVSMAYDPGDTPATDDDRLIVLEVDGNAGEFRAIDPSSPSTATLLGSLIWSPAASFSGMAYDSLQDKLYLASPFGPNGLWETDLSSCPPSPCNTSQLTTEADFFRENASLAFSPDTGKLYMIGDAFPSPGTRTFYNVIDPVTGTSVETLSLDRFTTSGLAAVPEPAFGAGLAVAVLTLAGRARRRGQAPARR